MSTVVFDDSVNEYITAYYIVNKPPPNSPLNRFLRLKKFPPVDPSHIENEPCRYYFYTPCGTELYNGQTFTQLVEQLVALGFEVDYRLERAISRQIMNCALVIRLN